MIKKSHRWQRTVVAAAAIALFGVSATQAWALSLGRISVQSALGEPLRAEIDVPNISSEEAASFRASVASPAAFSAAGLEYNAAMSSLQATLARKADGRAYLRLTTDKAINDPFVDMILEANWASGRIVRDFTMLFDPPSLKQAAAPAPTLPQTSASVPARAPVAATPAAPAAPEPAARPAPAKPAASSPPKAVAPSPAKAESAGANQVVVKAGDSASKIASQTKASDVSLDQMLVALLRSNPNAFSNGNLNRLRAGAVLDVPNAEQAKSISTAEASQTVVAQSKDFNEFRRNLAGNAPKAAVEAPNRKAAGTVEAKVEDKKATAAAADKLTLSKGALKAKAEEEAKVAKQRADDDAKARAKELAKNIEDLKKLSAESAKAPAVVASKPASAPAAPAVEVAVPAMPTASVAAPASAPASAAVAPAKPKASASAPASTMAPEAEPGLMDQLMEDPTLPLAGGGLLALLGGFGLYRRFKSRKDLAPVDSTFHENAPNSEAFINKMGADKIDTASPDSVGSTNSVGFTNSQMGNPDEVDPVQEADVYLAYGRDMQAEEILKSALVTAPERLAIHTKLLDIYAKRRDTASFQARANVAFNLVGAESNEWKQVCELGLTIDPENPLYQPGGATPSAFVKLEPQPDSSGMATVAMQQDVEPIGTTDIDLDLDFSADDLVPAQTEAPTPVAPEPEPAPEPVADPSNSIEFDVPEPAAVEEAHATSPAPLNELPELSMELDGLGDAAPEPIAEAPADSLSLDLPSFEAPEPTPAAPEAPAAAKSSDGMLEFDLGSLSLDLESGTAAESATPADNSLETKLALAEEFVSIGDNDGARALIEEVVAEATGDLRERAQRALASLT